MGNTFEVSSWEKSTGHSPGGPEYYYVFYYKGEDYDEAIKAMKGLKAKGAKCVKFMWRG